jgi:hypothetical protein
MHTRRRLLLLLLLILALAGCAALGGSPEKQRKSAIDDFMYALRWQLYQEAAAFFTKEHGEAFLDQMESIKDLNITDIRLKRTDVKDEGRRVEAHMEMDYFILPSATLKTLRIDQVWIYREAAGAEYSGFVITTPFPRFP